MNLSALSNRIFSPGTPGTSERRSADTPALSDRNDVNFASASGAATAAAPHRPRLALLAAPLVLAAALSLSPAAHAQTVCASGWVNGQYVACTTQTPVGTQSTQVHQGLITRDTSTQTAGALGSTNSYVHQGLLGRHGHTQVYINGVGQVDRSWMQWNTGLGCFTDRFNGRIYRNTCPVPLNY